MLGDYKRGERCLKRAEKNEKRGKYGTAIELYERAIGFLENDFLNQSYRIAQIYEKIAFCYEMLGNIQQRSESYQKAAKHYRRIGYHENADMCVDLRMSPGNRFIRKKS